MDSKLDLKQFRKMWFISSKSEQQLWAMKESTIEGHKMALQIEENREGILGLMSLLLGVILFVRSACQPAQVAEKLAIFT